MTTPRRTNRPTARTIRPEATRKPGRLRGGGLAGVAAAALASATAVLALTGCSGLGESICGGGEYPAMTVGDTGSVCVADEEQPPAGYVRYPKGKVPQQVDDKWDVYWRTHTVDEKGDIIDAPDPN